GDRATAGAAGVLARSAIDVDGNSACTRCLARRPQSQGAQRVPDVTPRGHELSPDCGESWRVAELGRKIHGRCDPPLSGLPPRPSAGRLNVLFFFHRQPVASMSSVSPPASRDISPEVFDQAIAWVVRLRSGMLDD